MDSKIITEKTYCDTLNKIMQVLRCRKVDLSTRHILFVPDKYTLECEQKLYAGAFGALDAEVLTLNRLFFRVCNTSGGAYLSKFGAIMLTRKIISGVKKSLKCFDRCSQFKGFAEKMYENIAQLVACKIEPQELLGFEGALGLKLQDISLIYSEYLRLTKGLFVDAGGRMELLLNALKTTKYFDNTIVYFANFDEPTEQTKQVIQAICSLSKDSYIGKVSGEDCSVGNVEVYESGNRVEQVKAVAKRIRNNAFNGVSYSDMAVAAPINYGYAKIMRIFKEFQIPYYIDKKCNLGAHPLGQYYKQLFAAANKIGRQEYVSLSKNPYAQIDIAEQDVFECYTLKYCVDYLALAEPFTKGYTADAFKEEDKRENDNLLIAECVRKKLFDIAKRAKKELENCKNAIDFSRVIELLLPENIDEVTKQIVGSSGEDIGDAKAQILNIAEVLSSVFSQNFYYSQELEDAFIEGLDAVEISLIPSRENCVTISDFTTFRGSEFYALYILDFNENFPPVSPDCGIITDVEIATLAQNKINLEPKIADVNERNFTEAKSLLSSCKNLFVTYLSDEHAGILINYLIDKSANLYKNSPELEFARCQENNEINYIARQVSCYSNAAEMLALGVCSRLQGEKGYGFESELNSVLGKTAVKYLPKTDKNSDVLTNATSLFFRKSSTTISRIQEYFACPYKHFLRYGLVLKERDDGVLSPLDIGTFLHRVIEIFVSRGRLDHVAVDVPIIIDQIIDEEPKYRLDAFNAVIRSITTEAVKIVEIVASQINAGTYKNFGVEISFGTRESFLKTLEFTVKNKTISLSGIIDRVDELDGFARVIDYKTGHAVFSINDLYYGLKIQLLIYMKILTINGFKPAGMFYFPFSAKWSDNELSHRLSGLFNNNNDLFEGMDIGLKEGGHVSEVIKARTKIKLNDKGRTELYSNNNSAYSTGELYDFLEYAYGVLRIGAKEILDGYIAKSPYKNGEKTTCEYCEMRALCGYDFRHDRVRKLKSVKGAYVLKSSVCGIGKEGQNGDMD